MNDPKNDPLPGLLQTLSRQSGDPGESLRLLEDAVRRHPGDPRILLLLGGHRMAGGEVDGAEAAFVSALQIAPDLHIARFQLGLLQLTSGRPTTAFATWAAFDLLPEDAYLRLFRDGFAMIARDRFADAERLLRAGIARNRENPPLNRDMERVIGRMPRPGSARAGEAAPAPDDAEASATGHLLVSAYTRPN